ncbi:hypothetical protein WME89_13330 [Sorangium sp. So ce321]|uniref:hypothetical protein n=1 Tax=Sorangium sp. So ce321 TaxID=3133300 RepID=UPI003F5FC614
MNRTRNCADIRPLAEALPRADEEIETGRFGTALPRSRGFTLIAKVIPGREDVVRAHGKTVESLIKEQPQAFAPLALHYLRWALYKEGDTTWFIYIGFFDTDFDKYIEDAVLLFKQAGINTIFEQLEGFPADWKENPASFAKFAREHAAQPFMEYAEYPDATGVEVVKALKVKCALSAVLDQMQ